MRIVRAIVIPVIVALGMAGSILAASAAPAVAVHGSGVHVVVHHAHVSAMYYEE
jgi:hypothetical protein